MNKLFLDMDGTIAKFNVKGALNRFENELDFFANLKAYKGIEEIDKLTKKGNVYIISASPNSRCDSDKMKWINKYLPSMPKENICFCRIGENKAKIIKDKLNITIDNTCYLLDDYTKNLVEWERKGGIGVKRLTHCADNSRGLWKGLTIKDLTKIKEVY